MFNYRVTAGASPRGETMQTELIKTEVKQQHDSAVVTKVETELAKARFLVNRRFLCEPFALQQMAVLPC